VRVSPRLLRGVEERQGSRPDLVDSGRLELSAAERGDDRHGPRRRRGGRQGRG